MLHFLPPSLKGIISFPIYLLNTILLTVPLILSSFLKLLIPIKPVISILDKIIIQLATRWISNNTFISGIFCKTTWDIRGAEKLEKKEWYLVLSNHQSWVDILVLQTVLNNKIPFLKFFLKKELIWVPFLGLAWWALDFPFMQRYTKKQLQKNPSLKGTDLERTKIACEKFKHKPVTVMNFVEGTRYTPQKHRTQNSRFENLLNPKAGGIAFVIGSMGEYIHKIIDITIVYPNGIPTFWDYISGQVNNVIVDVEIIPITDSLTGDYFNNKEFKKSFFEWLNDLWQKKDKKIKLLKAENSDFLN
jgi:1-acyl-sn-glycerol-3-phosphate acyltransferase